MTVKTSLEMSKDTSKPEQLITEHIDIWTSAILAKSSSGRGSSKKYELYGISKLRELILELAVRGKLVSQDDNDEPASVLLEKIAVEKAQLVKDKKNKETQLFSDDDEPFKLPKGWLFQSFINVLDFSGGGQPPKNFFSENKKEGYVQLIQIRDLGPNPQPVYIPKDKATKFCTTNDVMVGRYGASVGKVFWGKEGAYNVALIKIHNDLEAYTPKFIYLMLKSLLGQSLFTGISRSAQAGFSKGDIANRLIPLAPLAEQHRIVAKVDELMLLCDQLEQQTEASIEAHATLVEVLLATLTDSVDADELAQNWARIAEHFDSLFTTEQSIEALKQTVLQLAVMGKLVPQNPDDEPASVLLERINEVKSKLVKEEGLRTSASKELNADDKYLTQPHGWEWMRLGNLAKFIDYRGKTPTKIENGVRLITAKNIRYGYVDLKPEEFISEDEYTSWMTRGFPKQGDTLFTPEAPLGNAANIDIKGKFALAQRAICFQWHISEISDFLLLQILAQPFQLQLIDNATGMTATGIKASKLKEIPMIIPPLAEQHRIVTKVDELMAICDQLKARLQQSQETQVQLTDALIDKALG